MQQFLSTTAVTAEGWRTHLDRDNYLTLGMTQNLKATSDTTHSVSSVCAVRTELLNRLASTVEQLGRAKLNLRECLDDGAFMPGKFVTGEVQELRSACGVIRKELERHRASHGC